MTFTTGRNPLHGYRMLALAALTVVLVAQVAWTVWRVSTAGFSLDGLWRPLLFTTAFVLVAATRGNAGYVNALGRVTIAGAFLSALWSRFDNFEGFVRYTGRVLSFMPSETIWLLAVAATICEVSLCIAMFLGIKTRWASVGSAILLFMFATSMVISGLSQFEWAVYVLAVGAFTLATVDATRLSLDSIVFERERTWSTPVAMRQ
jgi:uncharacterized membrane protein YphA (DoxX/SURF4 family)